MAFDGSEGAPIDKHQSAEWTKAYREASPNGLHGHFFGRDVLESIMAQNGSKGIRFYYGLKNGVQHLLAVGADNEENDQLDGDSIVVNESALAPPRSGAANVLNS